MREHLLHQAMVRQVQHTFATWSDRNCIPRCGVHARIHNTKLDASTLLADNAALLNCESESNGLVHNYTTSVSHKPLLNPLPRHIGLQRCRKPLTSFSSYGCCVRGVIMKQVCI
jgi:hypothetical protein